jgi:hypothetical protein
MKNQKILFSLVLSSCLRAVVALLLISSANAAEPATQPGQISIDTDGLVSDHTGKPVAGATVELVRAQTQTAQPPRRIEVIASATSAVDGKFHLTGASPPLQDEKLCVRCRADGFGIANLVVQPDADPDERFYDGSRRSGFATPSLVLVPPMNLRGVVVNSRTSR